MQNFHRTLITGGTGFVGRHLRSLILQAFPDTEFIVTARANKFSAAEPITLIDLANTRSLEEIIKRFRPNLIVHLAAQSSVGANRAAGITWCTNVSGAVALAQAIEKHAPDATVLNVSSSEVYGYSFLSGTAKEDTALRPANVYGRTKVAAEMAFADILPDSAKLISVRPFNHAGPGQDERFVVASLAGQIARIERGEQAPVIRVGNLEIERDFLDVRDVARAYVALIQHSELLPMRSVFNICSGATIKISEILRKLLAITGNNWPIEQDAARMRSVDIPLAAGDGFAIRAAIDWNPKIAIDQTLRDVLGAVRMASDGRSHPRLEKAC